MSEPGLCGSCAWAQKVVSGKGTRFILCGLARVDAAYARYPRLPVRQCAGYRPVNVTGTESPGVAPGSP